MSMFALLSKGAFDQKFEDATTHEEKLEAIVFAIGKKTVAVGRHIEYCLLTPRIP